jgi:AAA family ATP:ADP antiporter
MSVMMMSILFIYAMGRDLKDTLVVNKAICGGAETLGFIKLFGVMPITMTFLILFFKLVDRVSLEKVFYGIIVSFLGFYCIFGFVLYPLHDWLHMSESSIRNLQSEMPRLYWIWPLVGNWTFSLFYIIADLWPTVALSVMFWQIANATTRMDEAKRFYSMFGIIGNVGLLISGSVVITCAKIAARAIGSMDSFGSNLRYQVSFIVAFGLILLSMFRYLSKHAESFPKNLRKKKKKSITESFKTVLKSKYLMMIFVLNASYGITMNLMEAVWKSQVLLLYKDPNDFNMLMGKLSFLTGLVTIIIMIIGTNILRRFSWKTAALITPAIVLVTSVFFFMAVMYENKISITANICGHSVLLLAVIIGMIREVLSKGSKYSLFDSTKQMAYIPLDEELKTKGHAAVEIASNKLGKACGGVILTFPLMFFGGPATFSSMTETIGGIVLAVVVMWVAAVCFLSKQIETKKTTP